MKLFSNTTSLIKSLAIAAAFGAAALAAPAQASTWVSPYGVVMSDTCVAPNGAYMVFANQAGPVGAACHFYFNGLPVMHYGVFR